VRGEHGRTKASRQETDKAMFVIEKQLLMFITGDGREHGTLRTVAEMLACENLVGLKPCAASMAATGLLCAGA